MDESETGSATSLDRRPPPPAGVGLLCTSIPPVPHFRLPSTAQGVKAFLWAFALAFYLFLFLRATGFWDRATDAILCALVFCVIFVFVRVRGSDLPA